MTFTELWSRNAEDKLANFWLSSVDRRAVTDAANKIDIVLSTRAETAGESRPAGRRIFHESPLGIMFSVSSDDRKVLVLDVWKYSVQDKPAQL